MFMLVQYRSAHSAEVVELLNLYAGALYLLIYLFIQNDRRDVRESSCNILQLLASSFD